MEQILELIVNELVIELESTITTDTTDKATTLDLNHATESKHGAYIETMVSMEWNASA